MKTVLRSLTNKLALALLALAPAAQAINTTNNFDYVQNYLLNGVAGDTNWDGVYLGYGDIPSGNPGGSGNGFSVAADSGLTFPNYLTIQTSGSDWAGAGDDGFFLWKLVSGDFDVSVQSAPVWNNVANNFAGLLVRAWNTNLSGAPVSFTSTNAAENFLLNWRFQEFGLNQVRQSTNGADIQNYNYPDNNSDTNSSRYFRITRTGDTFTFYWKSNSFDSWILITNNALYPNGTITRPDWNGRPLQVGIAQAVFTGNAPQSYFTDFELSGPNITYPALPAAPSNVAVTSPNTSGSVNIAWTPGAGSAGSLVVVRGVVGPNPPPVVVNPINGISYPSDAVYSQTDARIAGRESVVYVGAGNNLTVTGLGGSNNTYSVAVYSYSGSGASTVYNTAAPATNSFPGPGIVTNVIFTVAPTNIPAGGVGSATIIAQYSTGDSYNVSSDPSATLSSSDPSIVLIQNGVMNGLAVGTVTITAGYAGVSGSASVSVHQPVFTDTFGTLHDYIANGLEGSAWDGLFLNYGDVPGPNKGGDGASGSCSVFHAETNVLSIEAAGSSWYVGGNDGPYLFKVVTGDFQAYCHVTNMSIINNNDCGIMARLFVNSGGAGQGGGGGAGATPETHINWVKIQNGTPAVRRTIDGGGTTIVNGLSASDGWLLMQRVNSTNFLFFEKLNATDPWNPVLAATMTLPEAANNAPMEVGIEQEMRTASDGTAQVDAAMVDGPGIVPPATPPPPASGLAVTLNGDLSMTFNWVAADALGNPIRSALVMRPGAPVTAQPTLSAAGFIGGTGTPVNFGTGVNLGGNNWLVFATGNPAASTNVSCTVKNLTPGVTYYAAVYTFVGSGGNKSFNSVLPPTGATLSHQDGTLLSISTLPVPSIPLGGLQVLQVIGHFSGGATVNVSPFATITIANPSIVVTTNGALTGIGLGTTTGTVAYAGFTNSFSATVRPPAFTDNFSANHDYLVSHVNGTSYDGVYLNQGDVPETTFAGTGTTLGADANVSSNNCLTVTNASGEWENDGNDGFFLYRYVPGDFQVAVHITDYLITAYTFPGLGARAYSFGTNGTDMGSPLELGTPVGNANGEDWVSFTRFDEFGIGTYARLNISNIVQQSTQPNPNNGDNWILIIRQNGTNFNFYERASSTAPWRLTPLQTSYEVPQFANLPMQVGIEYAQYTGNPAFAQYDSYMLDAPPPILTITEAGGGTVNVSWPAVPGYSLQFTVSLSPSSWQSAPAPVLTGLATYTVNMPASGSTRFFRLIH